MLSKPVLTFRVFPLPVASFCEDSKRFYNVWQVFSLETFFSKICISSKCLPSWLNSHCKIQSFAVSFCSFPTLNCCVVAMLGSVQYSCLPKNDTCFCQFIIQKCETSLHIWKLAAPFSPREQSNPFNGLHWCKADWTDTTEFKGISLQHLCHAHSVLESIQPEPGCASIAPALNISARMLNREPIPFSRRGFNSQIHSLNTSQKQRGDGEETWFIK